ncbi:hypothetical protein PILCRDRAFT_3689 [Piloderma croceum F 1598]|uniref:Uncharacterized protein n=1 Tax=Piloderma croceum (strain F 1598) TaxID=765440 RepID=A0A0C3BNC1_PILCF|nr:hypothetical protein PILCRDRAFT_3689 [Piloderma croceum F 1598]
MVDSGTRNLLKSIAGLSRAAAESGGNYPEHTPGPKPLDPLPLGGWGLFEANERTDLAMSSEQQGVALIAQSLLDQFDKLSVGSADEGAEQSEIDKDEVPEPSTLHSPTRSHGLHEHSMSTRCGVHKESMDFMAVFPTVYMESMWTP